MGYCRYCGKEVDANAKFCSHCGASLSKDVTRLSNEEDSGSLGWAVIGFLIPIVGLILYLIWKNEKPKTARMAGKGALVSVIISAIMTICGILSFSSLWYKDIACISYSML